jgi:hypothetical protein
MQLIEMQLDSHAQARVVKGALQGRRVRNTIAFEGCKLASQLVAARSCADIYASAVRLAVHV